MRCSFRSTTALAAALALMAPVALQAETPLAPEAAAAMDEASRADMPHRAAQLDEELAKGLSADMLTCAADAPRPCADGEALMTPKGLGVHLAQNGQIILAPRAEQRGAAQAKGRKGDAAPAETEADAAAMEAAAEAPPAKGKAAKHEAEGKGRGDKGEKRAGKKGDDHAQTRAERRAEKRAAEPQEQPAAAEATPDAAALAASLAQQDGTGAAAEEDAAVAVVPPKGKPQKAPAGAAPEVKGKPQKAPAEAAPVVLPEAAAETAQPDAAPAGRKAGKRADPLPAAEPQPAAEPDEAAARAAAGTPKPAPPQPVVAKQAAPATAPAGDSPDATALAAALAAAAGGKPQAAEEVDAAAAAAATGQAKAPKPVKVDKAAAKSLEETLRKAAEANAPVVVDAGKKPAAAKPSGTPAGTSADAAAAAAASNAPVVEALTAPPTVSDDATAVVVTEDSARSSSEDFDTRITDGLTREQQARFKRLQEQLAAQAASGQPVVAGGTDAGKDDDNKERDLARMLLAGVGGYVLANVLANNGQIALSTPDRVVVQQPDGSQTIIKDDNALLLQPGAKVTTENFADGSSRSIVTREDGSRVVTIRDANLRVLRRTLVGADGTVTELINDAAQVDPVVVADLPLPARPVELSNSVNEDALRAALAQEAAVSRRFTLSQIRNIAEVRGLVAPVEINAITFDTGSAAIRPDQAQQLATLGKVISDYVRANPGEVFLIEGHTDTVGSAAMNLALSDRRAESVALALSQYFRVPPENLVVQGYGEQYLKVKQEGDVRANRRASVRRITDLLAKG